MIFLFSFFAEILFWDESLKIDLKFYWRVDNIWLIHLLRWSQNINEILPNRLSYLGYCLDLESCWNLDFYHL